MKVNPIQVEKLLGEWFFSRHFIPGLPGIYLLVHRQTVRKEELYKYSKNKVLSFSAASHKPKMMRPSIEGYKMHPTITL
jgi:hypothetical protein